MTMLKIRLANLSFQFHIKDILHRGGYNTIDEGYQVDLYRIEVPDYIKVTDDFEDVYKEGAVLPTVVITPSLVNERGLQIGGGYQDTRFFSSDIYGSRDGEVEDLTNLIFEGLDRDYSVYNYNDAFPEYIYDAGLGILVETYSGLVPESLSDLDILEKYVEFLSRSQRGQEDIDSHRAVIHVRTMDLR